MTTENTPATKPFAKFSADRLRWVFPAQASIFDPRPYLQKVLVEPTGQGGIYLVATNGSLMLIAYDALGTASHRFTFDPCEAIANACGFPIETIIIDGNQLHACRINPPADPNTAQMDDYRKVLTQEIEIGAGTEYPNWMPKAVKRGPCNPLPGWVDINLIEMALAGLESTPAVLSLTRHSPQGEDPEMQPVHIGFSGIPLRGVLMPACAKAGKPAITHFRMPFDA